MTRTTYKVLLLAIVVSAICVTLLFVFGSPQKTPSLKGASPENKVVLSLRDTMFTAWVADTPEERGIGLSEKGSMEKNEAMLFLFPDAADHRFWMKGMSFPIDIIWFSESLEVVHIAHDVSPASYPRVFHAKVPAKYVLEIQAGRAREIGIAIGDTMTFQTGENIYGQPIKK